MVLDPAREPADSRVMDHAAVRKFETPAVQHYRRQC